MYEIIFEISWFPMNSFIFGVARYSRLIAAINAASHKKSDKSSFVNPLVNEITPEAIKTIKINQSARFKPKASILIFLHLKTQKLPELNPCC